MKNKLVFFLLVCFLQSPNWGLGQSTSNGSTLKDKAHKKELSEDAFMATNDNHFLVSVYTNEEKAFTNKVHHWFLDIKDTNGSSLNYAKIKLKGYLKANPDIKFKYMAPVIALCNEGKYVIGFVHVSQTGPWVLEVDINNKSTKDAFTHEITIPERTIELVKNKD